MTPQINRLIKTPEELTYIKEGGKILGEILYKLANNFVMPGASTLEIDSEAERMIKKAGGRPSFKGYRTEKNGMPFPTAICASINDEVVHAPATPPRILKEGDIFSIDIGMEYPHSPGRRGFFTDTALTIPVGRVTQEAAHIIEITKSALYLGIEAARVGMSIADIGRAIESFAKKFGIGVVTNLVGHGVGYEVHEPPQIPNYYVRALETVEIVPGMVLALEPMFTLGSGAVDFLEDGWTVVSREKCLSAHFEHTIIIRDVGPEIVTLRPGERNIK